MPGGGNVRKRLWPKLIGRIQPGRKRPGWRVMIAEGVLAGVTGTAFLFDEDVGGVGDVQHGQVEAAFGVAFLGDFELAGDAGAGADGEVFDGADADKGRENQDEKTI